jgi:hypothetical protein
MSQQPLAALSIVIAVYAAAETHQPQAARVHSDIFATIAGNDARRTSE